MKSKVLIKLFLATVVGLCVVFSAAAQTTGTVYDNSSNDQGSNLILTNNQIIGVEILPDATAASSYPYLWSFSFELYGANAGHYWTFSGAVQGDVSFYLNTGVGGSPASTPFYNSGWFSVNMPDPLLSNIGVGTIGFAWQDIYSSTLPGALNMPTTLTLPNDFTVVFSFSGLDVAGGDVLGLANFQPQTLGTNYGDYWSWNGNSWDDISVLSTNSTPTSVGMQFVGSATEAPEPSTLALGALGGLLMTHLLRRRKV